ncbi:hypothetical protein L3N51_02036 [Metallosphaera sp. J1]|uniref:hypothetical protein n=1 Tax=Metallosphaera TaxID=41980 RepID=UPI001EE0FD00|nr:hypothetical protein [Metallosphaera javensis (ex Hofmann et al. 2022)]MCG3109740.1 hypothetical protein [Metallosphaera javensis (ex Hofmann et al. 2022)]BCS91558.1 MAG: hypothetical protein MjAS7_0166 [Metallosphaera javensis (ex Sakai et al. 2022)]
MPRVIFYNDAYICVKVDLLCGEGVDGYCERKDGKESLLVEIKESGNPSKIKKSCDQIENTLKNMKEGKPRKAYIVVENVEERSWQQISSIIEEYEKTLDIIIEQVCIEDEVLNDIRDILYKVR